LGHAEGTQRFAGLAGSKPNREPLHLTFY